MRPSPTATARKELDLLSRTGLGVGPIAPSLTRLISLIVGADACLIAWYDERGVPIGFFHDAAPLALEALFLNNYRELFMAPNEFNIFNISKLGGPAVGHLLYPSQDYFKSNTFNLLIKPCHHHHSLDARVDVAGVPRIGLGLFRAKAQPFNLANVQTLEALIPVLKQIVARAPFAVSLGESAAESGHFLVSADGQRITLHSEQAVHLLRLAKLFDQGVGMMGSEPSPPLFIKQLCQQLRARTHTPPDAPVKAVLDVVGGSLAITAQWMTPMVDSAAGGVAVAVGVADASNPPAQANILVTLTLQKPAAIHIVRGIAAFGLSPLQSQIAMFAAAGGSRSACAQKHAVSAEALKKHLREIYAASCCTDWLELAQTLRVPARGGREATGLYH